MARVSEQDVRAALESMSRCGLVVCGIACDAATPAILEGAREAARRGWAEYDRSEYKLTDAGREALMTTETVVRKFERIIPGSGAVAFDPLGADSGWLNEHDRRKVDGLAVGERAHAGAVGFIRRIA